MSEETKTPRTNEFIESVRKSHVIHGLNDFEHYFQMTGELSDYARQLERELIAITQERDALRKALEEQLRQMEYPDLPPAFAATMKRMISSALKTEVLP